MHTAQGTRDTQAAARIDRPVALRELVPVTRLVSKSSMSVINGVLTAVRVLQAA